LEADDKYYEVLPAAVEDKSMLGTHGEELCDDLQVHWMIQTCGVAGHSTRK